MPIPTVWKTNHFIIKLNNMADEFNPAVDDGK